ncbi:hypothetical protein OTU49_016677, partial [Cherax quadricarinatus]
LNLLVLYVEKLVEINKEGESDREEEDFLNQMLPVVDQLFNEALKFEGYLNEDLRIIFHKTKEQYNALKENLLKKHEKKSTGQRKGEYMDNESDKGVENEDIFSYIGNTKFSNEL